MTALTLFTAPKPFTNPQIAIIQENTLRSWKELGQEVEILLIGREAGLAEMARKLALPHLPEVECNSQGTPLIRSIFALARQHAHSPLLAYANADILLLPDLVRGAQAVSRLGRPFLMVGRRWNLDVESPLEFSAGWQARLRREVLARGSLYNHFGIDYFVFPRQQFEQIPPFAVGRAGWDNWMIYHARSSHWLVVDATPSVLDIHQNHDYHHLKGGQSLYRQEESLENKRMAGGNIHIYHLLDTNRELVGDRVRQPRPSLVRFLRWLERPFLTNDMTGKRWQVALMLRRAQMRLLDRQKFKWKKSALFQNAEGKDA